MDDVRVASGYPKPGILLPLGPEGTTFFHGMMSRQTDGFLRVLVYFQKKVFQIRDICPTSARKLCFWLQQDRHVDMILVCTSAI